MPAAAQPAINTVLAIGSAGSPMTFAPIANINDLSGPSLSADVVDVTSHSNSGPWRQKIVTLLDAGEVSMPCFFIPSSTGDGGHGAASGLLYVFSNRLLREYKLTFPDAAGTSWYFQGYIKSFNMKAPVAGVLTADLTFTFTGSPILA